MPPDNEQQPKHGLSSRSVPSAAADISIKTGGNKVDLASTYPRVRVLVNVAGSLILLMFLISVFSPLFTLEKFYFFSNTVSLASGLQDLLSNGEILLFFVIFAFSIVFPLLKLGVMFYVWNTHAGKSVQQLLKWTHQFGKWSMLDVFVVALLVVSIKFDHLATMQVHYGLTLFLMSVIASMLIAMLSVRYMQKHCVL